MTIKLYQFFFYTAPDITTTFGSCMWLHLELILRIESSLMLTYWFWANIKMLFLWRIIDNAALLLILVLVVHINSCCITVCGIVLNHWLTCQNLFCLTNRLLSTFLFFTLRWLFLLWVEYLSQPLCNIQIWLFMALKVLFCILSMNWLWRRSFDIKLDIRLKSLMKFLRCLFDSLEAWCCCTCWWSWLFRLRLGQIFMRIWL